MTTSTIMTGREKNLTDQDKAFPVYMIIGIIVGSVILLVVAVVVILLLYRRRRKRFVVKKRKLNYFQARVLF